MTRKVTLLDIEADSKVIYHPYRIWILAEHLYRRMVRRYRYIVILTPISALISMIPDIGVHPMTVFTRYLVYQISVYTDIGIISQYTDIGVYPISGIPDICIRSQYTDIGVHPT